jgi:glycine dehydrogenase
MPTLADSADKTAVLPVTDRFVDRHIGPSDADIQEMLNTLKLPSLEALVDAAVPKDIRTKKAFALPAPASEWEALAELRSIVSKDKPARSFIGAGYHDCVMPAVIQRNILENPGWYTQYTPYQPEISQGRLEALLNFQTLITELTGLPVANASLLDEGTAAAEAMHMARSLRGGDGRALFLVSKGCHPQTIEVVRTRAWPLGITVRVEEPSKLDFSEKPFAVLLQYPTTCGAVQDYAALCAKAREAGALSIVAADLLSLCLLRPPGEFGADAAVGSAQRFGVPMGYGGPHAAYFAVRDELKRSMPGRIIGVSRDSRDKPAMRLALQTREQHIRREKATSNICTSQVLLAVLASMYAVYHGPEGLKRIASRVRRLTAALAAGLRRLGYDIGPSSFFDTLRVPCKRDVLERAKARGIALRPFGEDGVGVSLDEKTTVSELETLLEVFTPEGQKTPSVDELLGTDAPLPAPHARKSPFLRQSVFNRHHSETEMQRYIRRLESRDLSLTHSMIPLGSCTMKLSGASLMAPVSWPEFAAPHPFIPVEQAPGYQKMLRQTEAWLADLTGFAAVSLQPNAGSQGEYSGLLVIRKYHESRGEKGRDVCLIPHSAHGTNPASAAMAGLRIVEVACDASGNIDIADLKAKAGQHSKELAALMVTYPSTHGVFETAIRDICGIVHDNGGQVYMDGANLNAQVGLCRPGEYGADVCHMNLHKTFASPHGGGGPGVGPIAVAKHLAPFLPTHPCIRTGGEKGIGPVSAAPWGSPGIVPITWMYIRLMGEEGLKKATAVAILNANYVAKKLSGLFPVLYTGPDGLVAHECILDFREAKARSGIEVGDVARRLMDHGFHAPTISFPVPGTIMVEPTESESKEELDRFIAAMTSIHAEIQAVAEGRLDKEDNPLKNAPHTADQVAAGEWKRPYSREQAAFPSPWTREHKFWPAVSKIDSAYGDRNLVATCGS